MSIRNTVATVVVVGALALSGCATSTSPLPLPDERYEDGYYGGVDQTGPGAEGDASGLGTDEQFRLQALQDPNSPLSKTVIYFDYDSDQVRSNSLGTINAHGEFLASNPAQVVRLEGHGDERGSREYNLALGERRAQSVRRLMQLQGVLDDQIEIISYGEELPAAPAHNEQAWQRNRRVEIVYGGQHTAYGGQ
jgi:peptidoglycan-associated lipoprotein